MEYQAMRAKLLGLFERAKLEAAPQEWGFTREICGEITTVASAANLSLANVQAAAALGAELLLTHHDAWAFIPGLAETCAEALQKHNMAHAFFHAPLDDAPFGTNGSLAQAFALRDVESALPMDGFLCARIGYLPEALSAADFQRLAESLLDEPVRFFQNRDGLIRKVCLVAGGGSLTEHVRVGVEADCDVYLTGEYSLYTQLYAEQAGINLAVGSHTGSERLGAYALAELLAEGTDLRAIRLAEKQY